MRCCSHRQWGRFVLIVVICNALPSCAVYRAPPYESERAEQDRRIAQLEEQLSDARTAQDSLARTIAMSRAEYSRLLSRLEDLESTSIVPGAFWEPIQFDVGRAEIRPQDAATLEEFARIMRDQPSIRIGLIGRADERGPEEYNLRLSAERARNARQYLIHRGIEPWRIELIPTGEIAPLIALQSETAFAENRSVQPVVLDTGEPVDVLSAPVGARVYFFRMGSEWQSMKNRLHDETAIASYRVIEGDTNRRTFRARTWYNVMFVRNNVRRFRCEVQVKKSTPNTVEVSYTNSVSESPCP